MTIWVIAGMILIGLITGAVTSLIGASGVAIVVPALTLFFDVNSHMAIGTSLLVDVVTSIAVAISYFYHGNVRLKASLWITVGSIIGAQVGSKWAGAISDQKLNIVFAIVLMISGIMTFRKKNTPFDPNKGLHINNMVLQTILLLAIGLVIGMISGLVGAGGGVMILLAIVFILHYPMHQAVGTSTVIMAITALSSLTGYAREGNVDWKLGVFITIGALIAGIIGARFANKISEAKLNKIVAIIFILLGVLMVGMRLL